MSHRPARRPILLILTNERDFACDDVIRRIETARVDVRRINIGAAATEPVATWSPSAALRIADTVWLRQFRLERANDDHDLVAADELLVQRQQWSAWLETLNHDESAWVNPLWAARRAENKSLQLTTALEVGLSVPTTIITNDRAEAARFRSRHGPAVVKALSSGYFEFSGGAFMFTRPLADAIELPAAEWASQPVVVQSAIEQGADVRVIAFGNAHLGARAQRRAVDFRTTQDASWSRCPVPESIVRGCDRYLERLGLRFGAFDFIDDGHQWWFLECNQAGEWGWLDRQADLGVAPSLAAFLTDLTTAQVS